MILNYIATPCFGGGFHCQHSTKYPFFALQKEKGRGQRKEKPRPMRVN